MSNKDISGNINKKEMIIQPSSLETIDSALLEWAQGLGIHTTTNEGWKEVPVRFVSPERAFLVKNDKDLRDDKGTLIFPQVSIERVSVIKDLQERAGYGAYMFPPPNNSPYDVKGGSITIAKRIQQEKTAQRATVRSARLNKQNYRPSGNEKVVYEVMSVPYPVHVTVMYNFSIRTEYAQQMNDIISVFLTETGALNSFLLHKDGHTFESFIQQDMAFNNNIGIMELEERRFETQLPVKVIGYLISSGKNNEQPKIVVRETAPDIEIVSETIVEGEIP